MVYSLRLVCLCLTSSRLHSFRPIIAEQFSSRRSPVLSTSRAMTTSLNESSRSCNNVGQADIGEENDISMQEAFNNDSDVVIKSWRTLLEVSSAKSRKIRGSNYVQLATVDPKTNEPRCRCVVFRGFLKVPHGHSCSTMCDELSCVMRMITHVQSNKVQQVVAHPSKAAELLWWFPKTSEQYRIRGELFFVGAGQFDRDDDNDLAIARKEQWGNLSDSARESFFANEKPGEAYTGESSDVPSGGRSQDGKVLPPPDTFLLMILLPKYCDYLRLTNMYRQVDELVDGKWQSLRVNP